MRRATVVRGGRPDRCRSAARWLRERAGDDGYATAEAAAVLPALLTVLALAAWVLLCVAAELQCVDAARAAARVAARGDTAVVATGVARGLAPPGARVAVHVDGAQVGVEVTAEVRPFGGSLRLLPAVHVAARAAAEREGVPGAGR